MYRWTEEKLRWMMAANRRIPLYQDIISQFNDIIGQDAVVCDAGCGPGGLSLALARYVKEVVAADTDARAIELLERERQRLGLLNITPICADIFSDKIAERFDVMVFCRFGQIKDILPTAYRYDCSHLVVVKQNNRRHRFDFSQMENGRNSFASLLDQISTLDIPFIVREGSFESGQPFTSLDDARRFFAAYDKSGTGGNLSDEALLERLFLVDDAAYPYFLPAKEELGIVICELRPAGKDQIGSMGASGSSGEKISLQGEFL